jgi:hypothetical protein
MRTGEVRATPEAVRPVTAGSGWLAIMGLTWLVAAIVLSGLAVMPREGAAETGRGFLLVADTTERRLYVYRVPEMELTGQVDDVLLGTHLGTLTLPDGRIVLSDDAAGEILALRIDNHGIPVVVNRVAAALGRRPVWGAADARFKYFAVASETRTGCTSSTSTRSRRPVSGAWVRWSSRS